MANKKLEAYFKRVHDDAILPSYGTVESACCDLYLCEGVELSPGATSFLKTGLIAIPPAGYHWQIYLRSSAPKNHPGLILANHVGIIDSDYCGPEDEIKLLVSNIGMLHICLEKGERIAQMRLVKNIQPKIKEFIKPEEIDEGVRLRGRSKLRGRSRGGFGSTGSK